jgi:hypothetical protein
MVTLVLISSFLNVEIGARASGMGGAFTGIEGDISCVFYNPSGIASIPNKELFFMHNFYFLDMYQDFFTFLFPSSKGIFALSFDYLSYGKIPLYENFTKKGEYTAYDMVFILSYGKSFKRLNIGANIKNFYRKIEKENSKGVAIDIGVIYKWKISNMGILLSNIGPKTKFIEESEYLPFTIRWGIGILFKSFILTIDVIKSLYSDIRINTGFEAKIRDIFFLRAGYSSLKSISIGIGIWLKNIKVDYAFVPFLNLYENTHKISLNISL